MLRRCGRVWTGCATTDTYGKRPVQDVLRAAASPHPVRLEPSIRRISPWDRWYRRSIANEVPRVTNSLPVVPRPPDSDFLIHRADDYFAAGKKAFQGDRMEEARRDFDRSLEVLLSAPENTTDRARLERHAEQLIDAIYPYDVDRVAGADADPEVTYEQSPIDDLLNMTFPVDPNLRDKVQEQIRATTSQLPLEENDAVVSFINFFSSNRGKRIMAAGLQHSGRYRPMIQRILSEEGVPQELIYLAQAESGFSPRAISRALCVGIWQSRGVSRTRVRTDSDSRNRRSHGSRARHPRGGEAPTRSV